MRSGTLVLSILFALTAGCNRQDTESLSRIGRKVASHTKQSAGDVGARLDLTWLGVRREPTLHEKVQDRLRFENTLGDLKFEVSVQGKEVELKGTVKNALQRQRAVELTETLAGVEKVVDSLKVSDDADAPPPAIP